MIRTRVAEILDHHVTFELQAIDRMYLNAYVSSLQTGGGFAYFVKTQLGVPVPSTVLGAPMSQRFVDALERFAVTEGVDLVTFEKGQRKDDVAHAYLAAFEGEEGVLFIGKAQEKASVFRTEKRRDARGVYPWIVRSTGQAVTVRATNNTMGLVTIKLLAPGGAVLTSSSSLLGTFSLAQQTLSTNGTYTVLVDPSGSNTGSLNLAVTAP